MQPFETTAEGWAALCEQRGVNEGEPVDLWEHALQTADQLLRRGADEELVVAGLFHDLGDGRVSEASHANWAAAVVRPLLGERVAWLIGAHVNAKRFACTRDPDYLGTLSPVSRRTLRLQGDLMTVAELECFAAHPWASDALLLRECDDAGKDPTRQVVDPERFRALLERVAAGVQVAVIGPPEQDSPGSVVTR